MTGGSDEVFVDPQQVANGLSLYDSAATDLDTRWTQLTGQIDGIITGAPPWGGDTAGAAFQSSFTESKPNEFITNGTAVVEQVGTTGRNVRTMVEASLGADEIMEGQVKAVEIPDGTPTSGGGAGGGGGGGGGNGAAG